MAICALKQYAGDEDAGSGESNPVTPSRRPANGWRLSAQARAGLTAAYYLRLMGTSGHRL